MSSSEKSVQADQTDLVLSKLSRRRFLFGCIGGGAIGLSGCVVSDPVIHRSSNNAVVSSSIIQTNQEKALNLEAELNSIFNLIVTQSSAWAIPEKTIAWAQAQSNARQAHIHRLSFFNPVMPYDKPAWSISTPTIELTNLAAAQSRVETLRTTLTALYRTTFLTISGKDQPIALFYASLAASAYGLLNIPAKPLTSIKDQPTMSPPLSTVAATRVLLTKLWSLSFALEKGLGILDPTSALYSAGQTRLMEVWRIRDDVATKLTQLPEQLTAYEVGTMANASQIEQAWAGQELAVLNAWTYLGATQPPTQASASLTAVLAQCDAIQQWGGQLPTWPGFSTD